MTTTITKPPLNMKVLKAVDLKRALVDQAVAVVASTPRLSYERKDREASLQVCRENRADVSRARVTKSVLSKDAFKPVNTKIANLKDNIVNFYTSPWYGGQRLLLGPVVSEFTDRWNEAVAEIQDYFFNEWLYSEYDRAKSAAVAELGDLFDPDVFPGREELRGKLKLKLQFHAIPANDIVMAVSEGMKQAGIEAERAAMKEMVSQPYNELLKAARGFVDRWGKQPNSANDANSIEKLRKLVNLAPKQDMWGQLGGIADIIRDWIPPDASVMRDKNKRGKPGAASSFGTIVAAEVSTAADALEEQIDLLAIAMEDF